MDYLKPQMCTLNSVCVTDCAGKPNTNAIDLLNEISMPRSLESAQTQGLIPKKFKAPLFVMWELTSACTAKCIHCFNDSGAKKSNELSEEQLIKIAYDLAAADIANVCLTGGDALLHKSYFKLAKIFKDNNISVATVNHGWLITEEIAQKMAAHFDSIQISIDGSSAEINDPIRGKGTFERAVAAIKFLLKAKARISCAFVPTKLNLPDFERYVHFLQELGVEKIKSMFFLPLGRSYRHCEEILPSDSDYKVFTEKISELNAVYKGRMQISWEDPIYHIRESSKSNYPHDAIVINPEGLVKVSPFLPIIFGALSTHTVHEVWNAHCNTVWQNPNIINYVQNIITAKDLKNLDAVPYVDDDIFIEDFIRKSQND